MPVKKRPHHLEDIVEQQALRSAMETQAGDREVPPAAVRPVITISRQYGALGAALGEKVAGRLGFELWDHELVRCLAQACGEDPALFSTLDEHAQTPVEEFLGVVLHGGRHSEASYLHQAMQLIRLLAERGSAVVVGRGAEFIVPGPDSFKVLCVSRREKRIREIARRHRLSPGQAKDRVLKVEEDREKFVRHHFGWHGADASLYDLILNTGTIELEVATKLVVTAYQARY